MFSYCFPIEDSVAAAWSRFTFAVLSNRSLASSDKLFRIVNSFTEESLSGSSIGISNDVLIQVPDPGFGLGDKESGY